MLDSFPENPRARLTNANGNDPSLPTDRPDLIHPKLRQFLREWFVTNRVLRTIDDAFGASDITCAPNYEPPVDGARRTLVEQYYHTLDFASWADAHKLLDVINHTLHDLEADIERASSPFAGLFGHSPPPVRELRQHIADFVRLLRRYGFTYEDGTITPAGKRQTAEALTETLSVFQTPYLRQQIDRMNSAVTSDPDLAIGTAKELIESTCKAILQKSGITPDSKWTITTLVTQTRDELNLLPQNMPKDTKALDTIKRILGNLGHITQGLAELRNVYGTGHGPAPTRSTLEPRHAQLARLSLTPVKV